MVFPAPPLKIEMAITFPMEVVVRPFGRTDVYANASQRIFVLSRQARYASSGMRYSLPTRRARETLPAVPSVALWSV